MSDTGPGGDSVPGSLPVSGQVGPATCASCGQVASEGARFCAACGTSLAAGASTPPQPPFETAPPPPPPLPPPPPPPPPQGYWSGGPGHSQPAPPPPSYPPGYHTPYPGYPGQPGYRVATTGTNGFAIASLVLGILWFWGVTSILALVFGYIALRQVRERHENGRGMALAGVILGWIGIVGAILGLVLAVWVSRTSYPGPGM
jgi:hypothetical protein